MCIWLMRYKIPYNNILRWYICLTQIIDINKYKNLCGQDDIQDQRNPHYKSPSAMYQRQ